MEQNLVHAGATVVKQYANLVVIKELQTRGGSTITKRWTEDSLHITR